MNHTHIFKLIASHSLVVAIFTNAWVIGVLSDIYRIVTNDQSVSSWPLDHSTLQTLIILSTTAFFISIVSFAVYMIKSRK
jgi:hypothetical protein